MTNFKRLDGERTTVEIHKLNIVKSLCDEQKITLKDYINALIKRDMMRQGEDFSIKYFKE